MAVKPVNSNPQEATEGGDRQRSGTPSPYFDLDASIKVSEAIHEKGGGAATADQLAAWLDYKSIRSGTYLTRVAAARQFGLVESSGGRFTVTDRGLKIIAPVMPDDAVTAKADAFLSVTLFSKIYDAFKGKQLPPEVGLKNLLKSAPYSILADRVDPAVRTFFNSAQQAGFFSTTGDRSRLIRPGAVPASAEAGNTPPTDTPPPPPADKPKGTGGGDGTGTGGVHSAIVGLLRELPAPGAAWPAAKKQRFLSAFQATIDFIYPDEDVS